MIFLKERAEIYRLALIAGLFNRSDVINWVDAINEEESDIDYALIEVSLNSNKDPADIALILKNVNGECDSNTVTKVLVGLLALKFEENQDLGSEIACMLYRFAINYTGLDNVMTSKINRLNDSFYLAEQQIYGSLKDITAELYDFLKVYKSFAEEF